MRACRRCRGESYAYATLFSNWIFWYLKFFTLWRLILALWPKKKSTSFTFRLSQNVHTLINRLSQGENFLWTNSLDINGGYEKCQNIVVVTYTQHVKRLYTPDISLLWQNLKTIMAKPKNAKTSLYSVVKFKENGQKLFESIPDLWFLDEKRNFCYWPPKGKSVRLRALNQDKPDSTWALYECVFVCGEFGEFIFTFCRFSTEFWFA